MSKSFILYSCKVSEEFHSSKGYTAVFHRQNVSLSQFTADFFSSRWSVMLWVIYQGSPVTDLWVCFRFKKQTDKKYSLDSSLEKQYNASLFCIQF